MRLVRAACRILIKETHVYNHIRNRMLYSGVVVHPGARIEVNGEFSYESGVNIEDGASVNVFKSGKVSLGRGAYLGRTCELGTAGCISIEGDTSVQNRCVILGDVSIGRHCLFAPNVYVSSGCHHF
jgi:acetyltransferase-like isoleucine patch superfamily enzyme